MAFIGFITAAALSAEKRTDMNDKPIDPVTVLEGLDVKVTMGQILKDTAERPLTHQGALTIVNHLRNSGFKIVQDK